MQEALDLVEGFQLFSIDNRSRREAYFSGFTFTER